jgi:hypothetical protein
VGSRGKVSFVDALANPSAAAPDLATPTPTPPHKGEGKELFRIGLVLGPRPVESGQRHAGGIDGDDFGKLVQRNF